MNLVARFFDILINATVSLKFKSKKKYLCFKNYTWVNDISLFLVSSLVDMPVLLTTLERKWFAS